MIGVGPCLINPFWQAKDVTFFLPLITGRGPELNDPYLASDPSSFPSLMRTKHELFSQTLGWSGCRRQGDLGTACTQSGAGDKHQQILPFGVWSDL